MAGIAWWTHNFSGQNRAVETARVQARQCNPSSHRPQCDGHVPRDDVQDPDAAFVPALPAGAPVAPSTSAIVLERTPVAPQALVFVLGLLLLAGGVLALGIVFARMGPESPAETLARRFVWGLADVDLAWGRTVSAVAAALTVASVAWAARTLTRSTVGGLFAGALVALDPALLTYGRLALPTALTLAAMAFALACTLAPRPALAWLGAISLAVAASIDPRAIAWGPVLALLLLLRGHIYASPRHLGIALLQGLLIPAAGLAVHLALTGAWAATPACLEGPLWRQWTLETIPLPGPTFAALPSPVTWFAGIGALLFLGLGGLLFGALQFRMARANGRLQMRLVTSPPPALGRGIWLLLLAVATAWAMPQALLVPLVLALALGVQDLGSDAPGFGLTLALVLLLFAAIVLWGSWDAVTGSGGAQGVADAIRLVPWAEARSC